MITLKSGYPTPPAPRTPIAALVKGTSAVCLMAAAMTASAGPAPKPDTTPPGVITNVRAYAAPRGLAIAFTATGDDGSSGQATRYRSIAVPTPSGPCAPLSSTSPSDWGNLNAHPNARPYAAGTEDNIAWPGLDAGTRYCLGVEVVDDAGLATRSGPFGPYLTALPGPGAWSLTEIPESALPRPDPSNFYPSSKTQLIEDTATGGHMVVRFQANGVVLANADTSLANPNTGLGPNGSTIAQATLSDVLSEYTYLYTDFGGYSNNLTGVASIPGGGVAVFLRARTRLGVTVPLFLEYRNGDWTVAELPWDPSTANDGGDGGHLPRGVSILYMEGQPILTYMIRSSTEARLYIAQRQADGHWPTGSLLLTRTKTVSKAEAPNFNVGALLDASTGLYSRLGLWITTSKDGAGGVTNGVYLVQCRTPGDELCDGSSGGWVWRDTGATGSNPGQTFNDKVGIDHNGKLRIVNLGSSTPATVQTIHEDGFGPLRQGLAGAATTRLTLPRTTLFTASVPALSVNSLAFSGSGYHVSAESRINAGAPPHGHARTRFSINVCNGGAAAEAITFDEEFEGSSESLHTALNEPVFLYNSNRGMLLARRTANTCP